MKLFLKEHMLLIIVQLIQIITVSGVLWFAGFQQIRIIFYCIFLSLFFLLCYLMYYYFSRKKFYKRLSESMDDLDESLQDLDEVPISEKLTGLLRSQYSSFQHQLIDLNKNQEEHLIFIDRWIHQMKTPISVIELMAKDLDEPESSSFREEIDRLKHGLDTVLYMARLRSVEQDFHIKKVSLNNLLYEINQLNKRLFIRNHVYPEMKHDQKEFSVETDEKWMFFILSQLIHNAVKYSTGKSNKIEYFIHEKDGHIILEIKDYGVGIPKEDMRRIFDPFYTGANGRRFRESTGVGLFLVKEVLSYLGQEIEVDSTVGEGSTFRIIF